MKNLFARLIGSLYVAAGSLAVALPAQAANSTNVACVDSVVTTTGNSPFYKDCFGPKDGTLNGSALEVQEVKDLFAPTYILGSLTYRGKSSDPSNGPFSTNPNGSQSGTLTFDTLVSGLFVVGLEGGGQTNPNYSYYLFDPNGPGLLSVFFDTNGVVRSNDLLGGGGPLEFATLYTLEPAQGGTVPEPAGIVLATVAFGALALTTRRRRS